MVDTSKMSVSDGMDILHDIMKRKFDCTYNMSFTEKFEYLQIIFSKVKEVEYVSNCCDAVIVDTDDTHCPKCGKDCSLFANEKIGFYEREIE